MGIIMVFSIIITAIATAIIAIYAFMSYRLASKIQSREDEFRQQTQDLFQAIVISNIVASGSESYTSGAIKYFKEHYKGKIPIFD
ncbi:hypothetical protein ACFL7M_04750 [Thermodesulfobacteriota bacterium]